MTEHSDGNTRVEKYQLYQPGLKNGANWKKLVLVKKEAFKDWCLQHATATEKAWIEDQAFQAETGQVLPLPTEEGVSARVLASVDPQNPWDFAKCFALLPQGHYQFCPESLKKPYPWQDMLVAWGLASYQFTRYTIGQEPTVFLEMPPLPEGIAAEVSALIAATFLVRDMINTPAEDCGPDDIRHIVEQVAKESEAAFFLHQGEKTLTEHFPMVQAVGRASNRPPLVCGLTWGNPAHPRLVLLGKGVCFDTGGVQVKPHQAMTTMKKDMGGAAHMLALAQLVMQAKLPVALELWIATCDNGIDGNAFRPGDVFVARDGTSVEIGHTDAEGRLLLADLLAATTEKAADLVIDYATLTGAQRVALGPEIPAFFTRDSELSQKLTQIGEENSDPMWPLPLYDGYRASMRSDIADISSTGSSPLGGAITAALFLEHFVKNDTNWVHCDGGAYNLTARPGRPKGGEAMGLRSLLRLLKEKYGKG